jgi:tRNA-dihydrouridine synthase B
LKLGALSLSGPALLAPLESVSDCAFRRLCHSLGASLTYTEMVRAKAVAAQNASTLALIDCHDAQVPTGVQLLAANERELTQALERIEQLSETSHPHFRNLIAVDLNFGCPSPDVIRAGAGPALLKRRAKIEAIFEALAQWRTRSSLGIGAITAKIRLGLNRAEQDAKVALPIAKLASTYLDGLAVHARHARQTSDERPSLDALAEIKSSCTVPVIGNGSLFTADDVEAMRRTTRVDAVLLARGAIRSPWLFRAVTAQGAGQPTAAELETAKQAYFALAQALSTKQKYLDWHHEGFARIRNRLAGKPEKTTAPTNSNL